LTDIFVPVISEKRELYSIKISESDYSLSINGIGDGHQDLKKIEKLLQKLNFVFCNKNLYFDVKLRNKEGKKFKSFDSSTSSINLGIYAALYAKIYSRELSKKYASVCITGNFDVIENTILLKSVIEIHNKFEAAKEYAVNNPEKKHLFLYVSDEEKPTVSEGWHENLFVIWVSPKEKIECIFAEIFEENEEQKNILKAVSEIQNKNGYVETPSFVEWKKELIKKNCSGFVLQGDSNCGKSIAAFNFCKYLTAVNEVDELVWITINDNNYFWNKISKIEGSELFLGDDKSEIIKGEFPEEFKKLDKMLNSTKKNICLVIDNLEADFTDIILEFLLIYKTAIDNSRLKILITTWNCARNGTLIQQLKLKEKCVEKLEISKNEFNQIFYNILDCSRDKNIFFESSVELQNQFKNSLYEQCFNENKIFPGFISLAIGSFHEKSLLELINLYKRKDIKSLLPKKRYVKISFEVLDPFSQLVLLTYIGLNNFWQEINAKEICKIINEKIFNVASIGSSFINEESVADSVRKLLNSKLLKAGAKNKLLIKKDILEFCIFEKSKEEKLSKNFNIVRDTLISDYIKLEYAIQNDLYEDFLLLLNTFNDNQKINELFIHCIEFDKGLKYLKPLVEKGINPDYKDKDNVTAIDTLWCQSPEIEVLDYLLEKGFKPRKKIPCHDRSGNHFYYSPLMFAVNNCNTDLVKRIINNHLYEDINEYEFQGKFTNLQLYIMLGNSVEILELLIKAGADVSLKTKDGWSLLSCAVMNSKNPEILEYLVENKLYDDLSWKDKNGKTALDYARKIENLKAVDLLENFEKNL
jgi:hypothetical protein